MRVSPRAACLQTAQMVGKKDDGSGASAPAASQEVMISVRDSLLRMESTLKNIERGLAARGAETPSHE